MHQLKVVDENTVEGRAVFTFAAQGGSVYDLPVRVNRNNPKVTGAEVRGNTLHVQFPPGEGYRQQTVTFVW